MEPRRLTGLLALIVVLVAVAVVIYFDYRPQGEVTASSAAPTASEAAPPPAAAAQPAAGVATDGGGMSSQAKEPAAPGQPGPVAAVEPSKEPSPAGDIPAGGMMKAEPSADGPTGRRPG
jgi:hypothetical protein